MNRRTLMMSASAATLGFAGTAPAATQKVRTLKFAHMLPQDSSLGAGAKVFGAEIARLTGGRYKIEHYPVATLGDEAQMLKGLQLGTVDLAFITGAQLPNYVLEIGVFSMPFVFHDASHAHDLLDGPIGKLCLEKFLDRGIIGLGWGEHGMRQITNSRQPIRTPDDLRGLKFGLPQSAVMMIGFEALGTDVNAVPLPALFGALQSGKLDGQENPIATVLSSSLFQVQKYLTLTNHIYDPAVLLMSPFANDSLSEEDRTIFAETAKLACLASRRYAVEAQAQAIDALVESGMQVITEVNRQQFLTAMAPARQKFESLLGTGLVRWAQTPARIEAG